MYNVHANFKMYIVHAKATYMITANCAISGKLYEGSGESKKVLEDIVDDLYLICLVDNDFVEG